MLTNIFHEKKPFDLSPIVPEKAGLYVAAPAKEYNEFLNDPDAYRFRILDVFVKKLPSGDLYGTILDDDGEVIKNIQGEEFDDFLWYFTADLN